MGEHIYELWVQREIQEQLLESLKYSHCLKNKRISLILVAEYVVKFQLLSEHVY